MFFRVKCFGSWGKKIIVLYRGYSRRVGQISNTGAQAYYQMSRVRGQAHPRPEQHYS
jgi:hypothetical protein